MERLQNRLDAVSNLWMPGLTIASPLRGAKTACRALLMLSLLGAPLLAQQPIAVSSAADSWTAPDGEIASGEIPGDGDQRWLVTKRTLEGGSQDGVQVLEVVNGKLRFTIVPTRGMSLHSMSYDELTLGWQSPVRQIMHPRSIDLNDHGGLGWLAGFNETMVRCGVAWAGHPGEDDGKLLTLHGRVGNIPASEVSVVVDPQPPHRIRIRGLVEERMFKFGIFELHTEVSTVPGSRALRFEDRLVNRSQYPQEYQIIYHANFGSPLLQQGSQVVAPMKTVAPFDEYAAKDIERFDTYLGPTPGYGEQVYCATMHADEQDRTVVMLQNAQATQGVAVRYNVQTLPFFTLWKNTDTLADGYVTGLEPGTGYPYNRAVERAAGRVPTLKPQQEVRFEVELEALPGPKQVAETARQIDALKKAGTLIRSSQPPRPPAEDVPHRP